MNAPRKLISVVLSKSGDHYAGALPLFGFAYGLEVRRHSDGIEVTAYDGPPFGAYRIAGLDDHVDVSKPRTERPPAKPWVEVANGAEGEE